MPSLRDKFRGCLLGAVVGDVAGAVVEAESPEYIARTYESIDQMLAARSVEEFSGPDWQVGRFTDDTQMMLCVAEWLLAGEADSKSASADASRLLLARFARAHERWRRYGSGTEMILRLFEQHPAQWHELPTAMFPHGSYGNGSAMRVAPIGLAYRNDPKSAARVAMTSSRSTHSHTFAYQGAVLQTQAVAQAVNGTELAPTSLLKALRPSLAYFADLMHDTSKFSAALDAIEAGLARGASCAKMSATLGTGLAAYEAVPMAIYCALRHRDSYAKVIHEAVFVGGDTDTIACMAGAISGALLGQGAIPPAWISAIREETYTPVGIEKLADRLLEREGGGG